jgi:hypothetical protein
MSVPTLTYDGSYFCASCGLGVCEHWGALLHASAGCGCTKDHFCDYHRTHPEEYAKSVARERASAAALLEKACSTICVTCASGMKSVLYKGVWKHDDGTGLQHCYAHAIRAITTDQASLGGASRSEPASFDGTTRLPTEGDSRT